MDSDQKYWLGVWSFLLIGICCLIISISCCYIHSDYRIAQAIKQGANPIDAKFAFSSSDMSDNVVIMGKLINNK